jgi:cyclase
MLKTRVIPCLLLRNQGLVKTVKFKEPKYVGDPINTVKIFNEKEVDELIFLDITATLENREPPFKVLSEIAGECFMPLAYGGGIKSLDDIEKVFAIGLEKVIISSYAVEKPHFIEDAAKLFGSQSILVSIDVKRSVFGKNEVLTHSGRRRTGLDPVKHAIAMQEMGAGELFVNSIDRDGTMQGYDIELIKKVSDSVTIPIIACGGAGGIEDFGVAVRKGNASAAAAGSLFVFHGKYRAVLISYPSRQDIEAVLEGEGLPSTACLYDSDQRFIGT